ncbi:MAG: CBS domain-containing protein [Deltaproteobacteria bacterium]|nr:CBS domain-containing protein [Deltaproteobacteria bacterium]
MRCDEVMSREVQSVRQRDTVLAAAKLMRHANVGFLPVSDDDGRVVGALTDRDIVVRLAADGRDWHTPIGDIMTTELVSCRPHDGLEIAEQLMRAHHTARVVCVDDDGRARGVVSLSDVARNDDPIVVAETLGEIVTREPSPR